jgi:hypothetical protein
MKNITSIASILIATCTISTGAIGQDVYRCGNTYSQKPCPDAVLVDVQDARSKAQKAEADAKTRRESAQVHAIEKTRQKEEAQQRAAQAKLAAAQRKPPTPKSKKASSASDPVDASAPKGKSKGSASKKQKKEPDFFIANAPADKPKPATVAGKNK